MGTCCVKQQKPDGTEFRSTDGDIIDLWKDKKPVISKIIKCQAVIRAFNARSYVNKIKVMRPKMRLSDIAKDIEVVGENTIVKVINRDNDNKNMNTGN
jgi:hypothetical protein